MRIDRAMPAYDAIERHSILVRATPERVWRELLRLDLLALRLPKLLLGLRTLPTRILGHRGGGGPGSLTLGDLEPRGFGTLAQEPGREILLGVAGRFWRPTGNVEPFDREAFGRAVAAGLARALWSFVLEPDAAGCRLATETRILCGDASSRRKFRLYWLVVRPFSGLIRRSILRAVRRAAESGRPADGGSCKGPPLS